MSLLENATFDIVDYFRNGFDLGGRGTGGGDIIAVSFNATAGKGFIQRYSSTSADNFNVTVIGGSFRNLNDSIIDANSFNVIAGTYFANESVARINVDNFNVTTGTYFANNSDSVIRAVSFNVTSERDFVNDTATINVDNFFNVTSGNINIDGNNQCRSSIVTLSALIVEELVFVKSSTAVTLKLSALIIAPSMLLKIFPDVTLKKLSTLIVAVSLTKSLSDVTLKLTARITESELLAK